MKNRIITGIFFFSLFFMTSSVFAAMVENSRQGLPAISVTSQPGLTDESAEPQQGSGLRLRIFTADSLFGFNGGNNLYRYADNNPMIYTDPTGRLPWAALALAYGTWGALESVAWFNNIRKECDSLEPGTGRIWHLPPALALLAGPTLGVLQYRPTTEEKEELYTPKECLNSEHRFGFPAGNCYYQIIPTFEKPPTGLPEKPEPIPGEF